MDQDVQNKIKNQNISNLVMYLYGEWELPGIKFMNQIISWPYILIGLISITNNQNRYNAHLIIKINIEWFLLLSISSDFIKQ